MLGHGLLTMPPAATAGLLFAVEGDLRSAKWARSGDRAPTCRLLIGTFPGHARGSLRRSVRYINVRQQVSSSGRVILPPSVPGAANCFSQSVRAPPRAAVC